MSIIHQALKRKARAPGDDSDVTRGVGRGAAGTGALWQASWFPGALAASGVVLAAVLTYLVTRPGEITVVIPPPATMGVSRNFLATAPAPPADPLLEGNLPVGEIPPGYAYQPAFPATIPNGVLPVTSVPSPLTGTPAPGMANPNTGIYQPPAQPVMGTPPAPSATSVPGAPEVIASRGEFPGIPVYGGRISVDPASPPAAPATAAAPSSAPTSSTDLPPNTVTIEMSEGRLESFSGGVAVNSTVPQPGAPLRVGSVVTTAQGAAATLSFERAQVDISGGSSARVSRLERRSNGSEGSREEVSVHLASGNARTVVRPGGGTVLISTEQLTAAATSGAFQVQARSDGSVTVQSEGGVVRLVPRSGGEAVTLANGERVTWRNNTWIRE